MVPWGSWIRWIAEKLNTSGFFFFFCFWKRKQFKTLCSESFWHDLLASLLACARAVSPEDHEPALLDSLCAVSPPREDVSVPPYHSLPCLADTRFLTELGAVFPWQWLVTNFQGPTCLLSHQCWVTDVRSHIWLLLAVNSGHHACAAAFLPTEPFPWPHCTNSKEKEKWNKTKATKKLLDVKISFHC